MQQPQSFLRFSIPHDERWWRLRIDDRDVPWIQQNLGHGVEFQKRFRTIPSHVALTGALSPGLPWSERVVFVEGENAPRVLINLDDAYNYHTAYATARQKRDPHLSPHGLFRDLKSGFHKHAFQFMQEFGPLFIDSTTRLPGDSWWVNLADFWDRHARFVAVAKLWEDRYDAQKLREHWIALSERHESLDRAGVAPLGYIPDSLHKFIPFCQLPWQAKDVQILSQKAQADLSQRLVYKLVQSELILHTQDCVLTWTQREPSAADFADAPGFQPIRCFTSLWGAIWELFGLDTRQYGWKLCRLCGKLFYPKDRRSVCCRTEHQSLWSKRVWARGHRTDLKCNRRSNNSR